MTRLRLNNVSTLQSAAAVGNNPITLTATGNSCSWSTAPALPLIAGNDFAAISVEPDTTNEEIIHVHGYTPGATTALVTRNAEPTQGGANASIAHTAVGWAHGPTALYDFKSPSSRVAARANFL